MKYLNQTISLSKQRGFTLIELMVVIAIVGILMAVAIPDFIRSSRAMQISHTAKELAGAMKLAQSESMRLRQTVRVCPSSDQKTCLTGTSANQWNVGWLVYTDIDGDTTTPHIASDILQIKQAINVNYLITPNAVAIAPGVGFNPAGEYINSAGNFKFSYGLGTETGLNAYVVLNKAGRIQVMTYAQCISEGLTC